MRRKKLGLLTVLLAVSLLLFGQSTALAAPAPADQGEEFVVVTAQSDEVDATTKAAKVITCTGRYDWPHLGKSSGKRAINAHLEVSCSGTNPADARMTRIRVQSRMTDETRLGVISAKSSKGYAKVGGGLACVTSVRSYRAVGAVQLVFPPGYTPATQSGGAFGVVKKFKKNPAGICVPG